MPNNAYRIPYAREDDIQNSIKRAPQYDAKIAKALSRTIEMIHGLADLHHRALLDEIEIYLGRSSDRSGQLLNRWQVRIGVIGDFTSKWGVKEQQ